MILIPQLLVYLIYLALLRMDLISGVILSSVVHPKPQKYFLCNKISDYAGEVSFVVVLRCIFAQISLSFFMFMCRFWEHIHWLIVTWTILAFSLIFNHLLPCIHESQCLQSCIYAIYPLVGHVHTLFLYEQQHTTQFFIGSLV